MRNVHTFIHSLVSSGELSNRTNKQELNAITFTQQYDQNSEIKFAEIEMFHLKTQLHLMPFYQYTYTYI